ncbi:MAG: sensor histidine kinase, partial [Terriglobia bacterium]
VIDYVALTSAPGMVLADSDPTLIGGRLAPVSRLSRLLDAPLYKQFRLIYGAPQVFEVVLPLQMKHERFCDVRVGVSTVFLGAQVTPHLRAALILAGIVVMLATLTAGLLSFRMLRPLAAISQSVDRIARGEFMGPMKMGREDEWGVLSSKLNLLGEQIRGEKAAYLALQENLDQILANLTDGLLFFDAQDKLVLATPSASRFLRLPAEQLVHSTAAEVFAGTGPLNRLLRGSFLERRALTGETLDLPGSPATPSVSVTTHFVRENGRQVASLVTLRDAGTRAQLEDQIGVATKLAAVGRLTSGVAHEVKNPLNAMILQVEIMKSKLPGRGEAMKPQLDILAHEIHRLDRVVKTFLDFNRPLEINRSQTDVAGLVREVFTLAEPEAQQQHVKLVLEPNGDLPHISLDPDLIKQALLNLVLNGCQAMPQGGELRVKPHAGPKTVDLEITDQGVGIPEDVRDRIFTLYYTTKPGGSGIGLAMAYRIIQLHDGVIHFSSEVNRGTTFQVSLPL